MYWYERYPVHAENWWQCLDWMSYGQSLVSFVGDIQFEYLESQIPILGSRALELAQTTLANDPVKFIQFLAIFRMTHPRVAKTPIYRVLLFSSIQNAKKKQDDDRRMMIQRLSGHSIDPRRPALPAVPQQGRI